MRRFARLVGAGRHYQLHISASLTSIIQYGFQKYAQATLFVSRTWPVHTPSSERTLITFRSFSPWSKSHDDLRVRAVQRLMSPAQQASPSSRSPAALCCNPKKYVATVWRILGFWARRIFHVLRSSARTHAHPCNAQAVALAHRRILDRMDG